LARARRLRGQKRVPLPPAKMTGRKSIAADIVVLDGILQDLVCGRPSPLRAESG
jgi:hypothetical protein